MSFHYLLEDQSGAILKEDGASYYLLENTLLAIPSASVVVDVYDNQNGSVQLAWQEFSPIPPDSYNVYVNGVFNQNVVGLRAAVAGLQQASNTPFKVVAVYGGGEIACSLDHIVTIEPASTMSTTPMRRLWPFPNTGLD